MFIASFIAARSPVLAYILSTLLVAFSTQLILAFKQQPVTGFDLIIVLLIGLSLILVASLLAIMLAYRASFAIKNKAFILLHLLVTALIVGFQVSVSQLKQPEEAPSKDPAQDAYLAGIYWATEQGLNEVSACAKGSANYEKYQIEFMNGCAWHITQIFGSPEEIAENTKQRANNLQKEQEQKQAMGAALLRMIRPFLSEGIVVKKAEKYHSGWLVSFQWIISLTDAPVGSLERMVTQIKQSGKFDEVKGYANQENPLEAYIAAEKKDGRGLLAEIEAEIISFNQQQNTALTGTEPAVILSKTPSHEIKQKLKILLPKDTVIQFVIPSGSGFMVNFLCDMSVKPADLINRIKHSASFNQAELKEVNSNMQQQEVMILVTEKLPI